MERNQIIDFVIPDIIEGTVERFESRDAEGNEVRILVDICRFLGDYAASLPELDVRKPSAEVPCTRCTLRYQNIYGTPDYAYTTDIHSGHIS